MKPSRSPFRPAGIACLFLAALTAFSQISRPPTPPPLPLRTPGDSIARDSLSRLTLKASDSTVTIVKHHFNHREQIITGSVVMACLAGIVVIMNNYNPRPATAQ